MQLPQPYLYTSSRMVAQIDQEYTAPAEGPVAYPTYGYHTLWIAEIPFIPAQVSKEGSDFDLDASSRFRYIAQRQIRFLYSLAQLSSNLATFELRFVSWPQPNGSAQVGIAVLGKVFHTDVQVSRQLALGLWDKFSSVFPAETPFSYPLVPIQHFDMPTVDQPRSFMQWFQPFPFDQLISPHSIVELRKYEDWPTIREIGNALHVRDYIPHPFVPAIDYSALSRLLETIARQPQVTIVAVTLRPQRLTPQEEIILHNLANWYKQATEGELENVTEHPLLKRWSHMGGGNATDAYRRPRAELGRKVYEDLVREMRSLFLVRLQVSGNPIAQDDVIEALGSEVMANADNPYPIQWSRVEATTPEELVWARSNMQWLEFARWGISPIMQRDRRIIRFRQLATVTEAAGAFRLPMAPISGGLAGIAVRDEPFSLTPSSTMSSTHNSALQIVIGKVQDRGVATNISYTLPVEEHMALLYLAGDKNISRSSIVERLYTQIVAAGATCILLTHDNAGQELARQVGVPYGVLNEAGLTAPFSALNPFLPPPSVSLPKFIDVLLRVFLAAYSLDASVTTILRQALLPLYERNNWTDQQPRIPFDMAAIVEQIHTVMQQFTLPTEIATILNSHCVLPLQDLARIYAPPTSVASGQVPFDTTSIILNVDWFGSDVNTALVYGSLWVWVAQALAAKNPSSSPLPSMLMLEDAPALFSSTGTQHPSPLASFIETIRQAGVATVLIGERAEHIDEQITGKAGVTIVTSHSNPYALEKVGKLLGLAARQQARLTHLRSNEAVVAVRGTVPVMVTL